VDLTEAYRECERITWSQARNFAYGIRLLPHEKRRGLAVIYAFARRIDDIGDGTLPSEQKIADLEAARQAVLNLDGNSVDGGERDDPVLLALADTERNFPVPMEAFGELIDGCVADVRGTHYETFEDLHYYCRCVAGSIGRRITSGIPKPSPACGRPPKVSETASPASLTPSSSPHRQSSMPSTRRPVYAVRATTPSKVR
jgi:phytoene/squalene synthetase